MREADRKVVLLGRDLLSYLPQPRQPSSTLGGSPGLATSRRVPCETCGARGRIYRGKPCVGCAVQLHETSPRPSHGCTPCLVCEGTGWRRGRKRELEENPWDDYAGEPLATATRAAERKRWQEQQELEARLAHTTRLLALWEGLDTIEETWEEVRRAKWKSGSYGDLVKAMEAQAEVTPRRVSVFWHVIVLDEDVMLGKSQAIELVRTVRMLADRMPKPIRVPRHLLEAEAVAKESLHRGRTKRHEQLRADRDARIHYERDVLGWSVTKIANRHVLKKTRVYEILARSPTVATAA